jgi:opacity protein-like surface antigen
MKKLFRINLCIATIAVVLMLLASSVFAAGALIGWTANTEADLAGYHIYQSTSPGAHTKGTFQYTILKPLTSYTVPGLADGTYYWVLTAYDQTGNESAFSDEVSLVIQIPPAKVIGVTAVMVP